VISKKELLFLVIQENTSNFLHLKLIIEYKNARVYIYHSKELIKSSGGGATLSVH
jgi:hypothetical protein